MNSDIEDDIMDPVMQCTTLPSHSGFSQQKLVSFVTEIHTTSIDFLTPMKMEILLEPTSNKLLVQRIENKAKTLTGGPTVAPVTARVTRGHLMIGIRGSVRGSAFEDSRRTRGAISLAQNGINSLALVVILGLDPDATVANHWKLMRRWELRIDQRAPISGSIIGWIPERMKLPLPILGLYKSTDAAI
ncbi:hypothetical protein Tco_0848099 [Tanacetum coccineum]